jgi:hypothetical protein
VAFEIADQRLAKTPIRGRADELKAIGAQLDALAHGRGGVLVIEGPGIGKSRLLAEVSALTDGTGVRTLFGEASVSARSSVLRAVHRTLAEPPVRDIDAAPTLARRLGTGCCMICRTRSRSGCAQPTGDRVEDIHGPITARWWR